MSVTDSNPPPVAKVRKRNDFRLAMQAKLTAEVCGSCGCGLAAGEPVYIWVAHRGYGAFGGSYSRHYAPVCEGCAPRWMVEQVEQDRSGSAPTCDWCSRVVVYRHTGREYLRKHVFCCERCQWRYYNRRRSAADSWAREKVCQVCAEPFTATRAHAKTCSPACKQAAYRIRNKRKEY